MLLISNENVNLVKCIQNRVEIVIKMISCKNIPTRTYARTSKSKEEIGLTNISNHGEIPFEFENACRLCLENTEVMTEIFSDVDSIIPTTVKIKYLLGLEVCEYDRLPTLMCDSCALLLNQAYNFKKKCVSSDVKLRQYLCKWPTKPSDPVTRNENVNDITAWLDEELSSKTVKDDCTISWDDQVPLAAMIISGTADESNNNLSDPLDTQKTFTELEQLEVESNSDNICSNGSQNTSESITGDGSEEVCSDITREQCLEIHESPVKSFKILKSSDYVCKIKRDVYDDKAMDLDDVPLSERLRIQENMIALAEQRKRKNQGEENLPVNLNLKEVEMSVESSPMKSEFRNIHICSVCTKPFLTPSLLARHMRVHTGEKPFQCKLCLSSFSQKEILQRHQAQVHTDKKPFVCKHCGKSFGAYSILAAHVKTIHVMYGQFKCKLCPKVFRHASGLSRHQNTHTGTYFYCKLCGKNFNDGSSVKRHVRTLH